jgi:hypothetical protein
LYLEEEGKDLRQCYSVTSVKFLVVEEQTSRNVLAVLLHNINAGLLRRNSYYILVGAGCSADSSL